MTVDQILIALRRGAANDYPLSVSPHEALALAAEVERLREMLLNAGWPREAEELAAEALRYERAAVVAWLLRNHYDDTAERIERGEHRRVEGE